jgi:hypothetical protein
LGGDEGFFGHAWDAVSDLGDAAESTLGAGADEVIAAGHHVAAGWDAMTGVMAGASNQNAQADGWSQAASDSIEHAGHDMTGGYDPDNQYDVEGGYTW